MWSKQMKATGISYLILNICNLLLHRSSFGMINKVILTCFPLLRLARNTLHIPPLQDMFMWPSGIKK